MREDLTGKHFGKLSVIGYNDKTKKWICECECGNKTEVLSYNLRLGNTKSCGCSQNAKGIKRKKPINIMNEKIGQLYVTDVNKTSGYATVKCLQCKRVLKMPIQQLIDLKKTRKKSITCGLDDCKYTSARKKNGDIKEGTKFGRLTVLKRLDNKIVKTENTETSIPMYLCKCDCGNEVEVQGRYLLDGRTKSCGCLRQKNFLDKNTHKNLILSSNGKKLYKIFLNWQQKYRQPTKIFQRRIIDEDIKFFPELKDKIDQFQEFYTWALLNGFNEKDGKIYLDRKDYNKDFSKDNCFWTKNKTRGY